MHTFCLNEQCSTKLWSVGYIWVLIFALSTYWTFAAFQRFVQIRQAWICVWYRQAVIYNSCGIWSLGATVPYVSQLKVNPSLLCPDYEALLAFTSVLTAPHMTPHESGWVWTGRLINKGRRFTLFTVHLRRRTLGPQPAGTLRDRKPLVKHWTLDPPLAQRGPLLQGPD